MAAQLDGLQQRIATCIAANKDNGGTPSHIVTAATCAFLQELSGVVTKYEAALRECTHSLDPHASKIAKAALGIT